MKERVKNVLNYKKPAFWVTIAAVLLCVAAAVCFLTDPVEKTEEDPAAAPLAAGEEVRTYTGGALLYMQAALNYLPPDGSYYARVQVGGGKLDITFSDGGTYSGELVNTEPLDSLFLHVGFDNYARDIGLVKRLCPDNCSVEGRVYSDGDRDFTLWQFSEADGGALWLGEGSIVSSRLYELIDLEEAFPAPESGGFLWTANGRNFLPVSFDKSTNVSVTSGTLYSDPGRGGGRKLSNTLGTVYWSPYGEDGTIPAGARLHYEIQGTETQWTSMGDITLRPVSKSVGGFGQTYALECAWVENVSRFPSALVQDQDTGELMVSTQPGEVQEIGRIVSQNAWWLEYPQTVDAASEN